MDTVKTIIVGCLFIIWTVGLVHTTFCQESYGETGKHFLNVCQSNNVSVENDRGYIVLDPAEAPLHQDLECKCYLSFDEQLPYIVYLVHYGDVAQNYFKTTGTTHATKNSITMTVSSKTAIIYQQTKQDHHTRVCMGISNADSNAKLTVECEAFQREIPRASTTELTTKTTLTSSMSKRTSTLSILKETSTRPVSANTHAHSKSKETSTHSMSAKTSTLSLSSGTPTPPLSTETPTRSISEGSSTHPKSTRAATRPMQESSSACSIPDETSTLSMHTDKDGSTSVLIAILGSIVGVVVFLIGVAVCCVVKRKRRSTNEVSEDSNRKRIGPARELTGSVAEGAIENATTDEKHDSIMPSEYVYIDQCDITASDKIKPETVQAESDVYNHLDEVQPGPHSDNVYSTTHVYNTAKQQSGAMSKHGPAANPSESDVYNHLNEVQPGQHSDNIYNATNVNVQDTAMQESGATSSQYDSVELVKRKHHAPPESDYNVLSFP